MTTQPETQAGRTDIIWPSWAPSVEELREALPCNEGHYHRGTDPCDKHIGETGFHRCEQCRMRDRLSAIVLHPAEARSQAEVALRQENERLRGLLQTPKVCGCTLDDDYPSGVCRECHHREHGASGCRAESDR
jgi:hypothetical protein